LNDQPPLTEDDVARLAEIPAIRISMQHQLHGKYALAFETHVLAQCPAGELDDRLDKIRKAAERQRAIANLPTRRGILAAKRDAFEREKEKLLSLEAEAQVISERWSQAHIDSGRRGPIKESPQQRGDKARIDGQIQGARQQLNILINEIAVCERIVGEMEKVAAGEALETSLGWDGDASDRTAAGL